MEDRNTLLNVKIYDHIKKEYVLIQIEEVIKIMVASQMRIDFELEALKAQAIMARTFIIKNMKRFGGKGCLKYMDADLCTEKHCKELMSEDRLKEVWGYKWKKIERAVYETGEKIMMMNNKLIDPKSHVNCGGATENSEKVVGNKVMYLRRVLCDSCKDSLNHNHTVEMSLEEIEKRLGIKTAKVSPLKGKTIEGIIEEVERDEAGRVVRLKIGEKELKGTEARALLGLSSTRFGWKPVAFQIEVQGEGDGLGLCQDGANRMAMEGKCADEILKYYFTGIEIKDFDRPDINKPLVGKVIVVDAGHGGDNTEDEEGPTGLREKDINLAISLKLAQMLRDAGAEVYETRVEDVYVSLAKRVKLANKVRPDFFLSIHQNSFKSPKISGTEIYHYRGDHEGKNLAEEILKEICSVLGTIPKGVKVASFYLLREVGCSALQIEVAFITNPDEEKKLREVHFQNCVAEAILNGMVKYYRYE